MPSTSLGGWFDKVFFDAHGEPCASGELRFYQTGTDIPQGVATFDGTPLGAVIRLDDDGRPESDFRFYTDKIYRVVVVDADGVVVKTIDGVAIPEGEGGGMYNPMTAAGDVIVGGTDGAAERLAPGNEGQVLKVVSGVPAWAPDAEGMQNPMTTAGDLIVGTTGGEPARLGVGTDGDILATASEAPTWEGGPKKYRVVYGNVPSSQIDDGYLGCLFYLSGYAQTLELPSAASIPSKSFIDFVFLDNAATLTITPQGGSVLNAQGSAITIGGQAASMYRLTFLGHGGSGDEWALGGSGNGDHKVSADGTDTAGYLEDKLGAGSGISLATSAGKVVVSASTQPGDHKTAVDGADASPDYLAAKLAAGSGISLTNTGSAVEIAATTQTGDHQLLVSATDASAGYLGAKLTAGANVTLTTNTDGDGVQTLEISATGGGGGGGVDEFVKWTQEFVGATGTTAMSNTQSIVLKCYADTDMIPEEVVLPCDHQYANTTYKAFIVVGTETFNSSTVSFSGSVSIITPATTPPRVAHIPLTGKNGFTKIEEGKTYFLVFGKSGGGTSEYFKQDYGVTLYHARTYAGAITETPNWVWNNASAQTGLPIVGLKFKRE